MCQLQPCLLPSYVHCCTRVCAAVPGGSASLPPPPHWPWDIRETLRARGPGLSEAVCGTRAGGRRGVRDRSEAEWGARCESRQPPTDTALTDPHWGLLTKGGGLSHTNQRPTRTCMKCQSSVLIHSANTRAACLAHQDGLRRALDRGPGQRTLHNST